MTMKLRNILWMSALSTLAFVGCTSNNDENSEWNDGNQPVSFSSSIQGLVTTKAAGTSWAAGDAVGIFMTGNGNPIAQSTFVNKRYLTDANGNFSAATADEAIFYPKDDAAVDFIAYYPYAESLSNHSYAVNVADQTTQATIDLMYSNNATGLKNTTSKANLSFSHQLVKINLVITKGEGISTLDGLNVSIGGTKTRAAFALGNAALTIDDNSVATIQTKVAAEGTVAEAIILPVSGLNGGNIVFSVPGAGTFKWDIPAGQNYEKGKKYTYEVELKNSNAGNVVEVSSSITDWVDIPSGSIDVDFGNGGGTDPDPEPGTQTIFVEKLSGAGDKVKIAAYTGWDNPTLTFSDEFGIADIRGIAHKTDENRTETEKVNNVWLPATKDASLKISGIKAAGYTNLKLTYEAAANVFNAGTSIDLNKVIVKWNGETMTTTSKIVSKDNNDANVFFPMEVTSTMGASENATLEFFASGAENALGLRIYNIKLVGDK